MFSQRFGSSAVGTAQKFATSGFMLNKMLIRPSTMPIQSTLSRSRFPSRFPQHQYQHQHAYSTSGRPGSDTPKFRYLAGIVVLSSIAFYFASRSLDKKAPITQYTEADYDLQKRKTKLMYKKSAFTADEAAVVFVLGGPGAGKGTQCANLVKDYGFVHLSAGDLLREEQVREGSEYGQLIASYIKEGKIVPQEVTIALLRNAMKKVILERLETDGVDALDEPCRFLIDGFPRQMDQALKFEEDVAVSRFTLFFECPEEVMLKRLLKRGETSGRTDDNIESIKKRFHTFIDTSMPVVNYFDKSGKVVKIHCNQPVDLVYRQVQQVLKEKLGIRD